MENELQVKIIEWYNNEKITITEYMKEFDAKFQKYQDYQKRLLEIDKILKEII